MTPPVHVNPTVDALNRLSILQAHQGGAYREHSAESRAVLGDDIETAAQATVDRWVRGRSSGVLILTGNAGTGKTALAEVFCAAAGVDAPTVDGLRELADGRVLVCKDLSGVPEKRRGAILGQARRIIDGEVEALMLLCANEGVLTPLLADGEQLQLLVEQALVEAVGAGPDDKILVLNMNRQRWTGEGIWPRLLDYAVGEAKWAACSGCPVFEHCPIRRNAAALRRPEPREALRHLMQIASAETVAPLREMLTVVSHGVTGGATCGSVIERYDREGRSAFTAAEAYFNLLVGGGLAAEDVESVPVFRALAAIGIGEATDLQADAWLREARGPSAPESVASAGGSEGDVHAQVRVIRRTLTFAEVGELITVDPDRIRVEEALRGMLATGGGPGYLKLWRRRLYFEAHAAFGGARSALGRLSHYRSFGLMLGTIDELKSGREPAAVRKRLVQGLNFLGAGMPASAGELHLPDPGMTAARDLGSFLPPPPLVVSGSIPIDRVHLGRERVQEHDLLDHDDIRIRITVEQSAGSASGSMIVSPSLFEALIGAADYCTPPGPDAPESAELGQFYARVQSSIDSFAQIRIADGGALKIFCEPNMDEALDGRF
jgi:hypothetical protein